MTQVSLELVDVVGALASPACVLAVDGVDAHTPGTGTKNERILRPHRAIILRIPLDGKVEDGLLVLVLEQAEDREGLPRDHLRGLLWNFLEADRHPGARLI